VIDRDVLGAIMEALQKSTNFTISFIRKYIKYHDNFNEVEKSQSLSVAQTV
jgi:hypothetical protein